MCNHTNRVNIFSLHEEILCLFEGTLYKQQETGFKDASGMFY